MALNARQQMFVAEYLRCFNATEAAIKAGYSGDSAYSQGHKLLKKGEISDAVEGFLAKHAMTAAEVLYHLTEIARADIGDVLDEQGNLDMKAARNRRRTRLIKRVKVKSYTTEEADIAEQEVEMHDRLKALELLAKYHDLVNKVRIDDWRSEAVRMIQRGEIDYEALVSEFGDVSLADQLFAEAGIPIGQIEQIGAGAAEDA